MTMKPARILSVADIFSSVFQSVMSGGRQLHENGILRNAEENLEFTRVQKTIREVKLPQNKNPKRGLVISAGPSLFKRKSIQRIRESKFDGVIVAIDASLSACLREGLIPDFVLTLDPHVTRMVRWFGDPQLEENSKNDDYFLRQDLDVEFRANAVKRNADTIELINKYGKQTRAIVASTAPRNVVARINEAGIEAFWWNPLVDNPGSENSLTRRLFQLNRLPSMNTGGNVGSAAWVFASTILKIPEIGMVGMDMGYYADTPYENTQLYYEYIKHLGSDKEIAACFKQVIFPFDGQEYYTDPTYYWYRCNFLSMVLKSESRTINCTEGRTLFGEGIVISDLEGFLS
ncbi:MAG: DUF115 domain-containing protein [Bdellovibrionales bacterium]|nr:DUF115 domain-containing protein [Bdellovibrionales bacterium]